MILEYLEESYRLKEIYCYSEFTENISVKSVMKTSHRLVMIKRQNNFKG